MGSVRTRLLIAVLTALVAVATGTAAFGQAGDDDDFTDASERVTTARGGDGGDARGGDGGRGGSGFLPVCNQNSNDDDDFTDNEVECIAGASGGQGGDGGDSYGGDGGVAFNIGDFLAPAPPPPPPSPLADLIVQQRRGSFVVSIVNNGPAVAAGIRVTDTLRMSTGYFLTVTPSQGTCTGIPSGEIPSGSLTFTCDLGDLGPGQVATVVVDPMPVEDATAVNDASATSATPDPNGANNSSSLSQNLILIVPP